MVSTVTWGLFVAWLLHDAEELITMPRWGWRSAARLRRLYPRLPERLLSVLDRSRAEVTLAIGRVVITAPVLAAPFSLYAWHALDRAHLISPISTQDVVIGVLAFPAVVAGAHGVAGAVLAAAHRAR